MTKQYSRKEPAQIDALVPEMHRLYESGWSAQAVADHIGIDRGTVLQRLRKVCTIRSRGPTAIVDEQEILQFYRSGMTIKEVASTTRHAPRLISDVLHKAGVVRGAGGSSTAAQRRKAHQAEVTDEIMRLYHAGLTTARISLATGRSSAFINTAIHMFTSVSDTPTADDEKDDLEQKIIDLYKSGLTVHEVRDATKADQQVISDTLNAAGVMRKRGTQAGSLAAKKAKARSEAKRALKLAGNGNWKGDDSDLLDDNPHLVVAGTAAVDVAKTNWLSRKW